MVLTICVATAGSRADISASARLTASQVRRWIQRDGARLTLARVFDDNSMWERLVDGIATGGAGWMQVAKELRGVSDGGATSGLNVAMQEALARDARGVLAATCVGHDGRCFTVRDVCGGYGFGQVEDERPTRVIVALVDKRVALVKSVTDARLSSKQEECLAELGRLRDGLR